MKIILASQSPRRRELLQKLIPDFLVLPSGAEETVPEGLAPEQAVLLIAEKKAACIRQQHPEACIIAADTVVVIDGLVLGKPADRGAAEQMLHRLSGRVHTVYTGMVVLCGAQARRSVTATQVEFYPLTPAEITRYIDSGAPFDKAGGYGIQDGGCVFVKGINGDWYNVMGLPVAVLYRELSALNVACL